jgi:hypothetical protein
MDEADKALHETADENLLRAFATLTHRLHADVQGIRIQRDRVQEEILRRMKHGRTTD